MRAGSAGDNVAERVNSTVSAAGHPRDRRPATAEYLPLTASSGNLRASCADCGTRMYRRVSLYKLAAVAGDLQVSCRKHSNA